MIFHPRLQNIYAFYGLIEEIPGMELVRLCYGFEFNASLTLYFVIHVSLCFESVTFI